MIELVLTVYNIRLLDYLKIIYRPLKIESRCFRSIVLVSCRNKIAAATDLHEAAAGRGGTRRAEHRALLFLSLPLGEVGAGGRRDGDGELAVNLL